MLQNLDEKDIREPIQIIEPLQKKQKSAKNLQQEKLQSELNILTFYENLFRGIFQDTLLEIYRYSKQFHKKGYTT